MKRWTVKTRRRGTVHIHRWWETCLDGVAIDAYETRELADAYVAYANARLSRAATVASHHDDERRPTGA